MHAPSVVGRESELHCSSLGMCRHFALFLLTESDQGGTVAKDAMIPLNSQPGSTERSGKPVDNWLRGMSAVNPTLATVS
jgi:hypothetical protein